MADPKQQTNEAPCSVCGASFVPRYQYQVQVIDGQRLFFCSQLCLIRHLVTSPDQHCHRCNQLFKVQYAFQVVVEGGSVKYFCSDACRESHRRNEPPPRSLRRIAVLNQKGGTGKTTTAVNLAAAFAARGHRTLLLDLDPQGNVGISLGIREHKAAYRLFFSDEPLADLCIPIRENLDVVTADETLARVDLELVGEERRAFRLHERLSPQEGEYDFVVMDCAPALSLLNRNALVYAREVVIPVSCDYLALVGVKQVLRTIRDVRATYSHDLVISGVVPTFFDVRNKISHEVLRNLANRFPDQITPSVRVNTRLKEAPVYRQTIFEYDPTSYGAEDYLAIAGRLLARGAPVGLREDLEDRDAPRDQ